jgi:hypothetical protein
MFEIMLVVALLVVLGLWWFDRATAAVDMASVAGDALHDVEAVRSTLIRQSQTRFADEVKHLTPVVSYIRNGFDAADRRFSETAAHLRPAQVRELAAAHKAARAAIVRAAIALHGQNAVSKVLYGQYRQHPCDYGIYDL